MVLRCKTGGPGCSRESRLAQRNRRGRFVRYSEFHCRAELPGAEQARPRRSPAGRYGPSELPVPPHRYDIPSHAPLGTAASLAVPGMELWALRFGLLRHQPLHHPADSALRSEPGQSIRDKASAAKAPMVCATTNPGTSAGRIPENVFVSDRATVIAGLANEVEAVNQ